MITIYLITSLEESATSPPKKPLRKTPNNYTTDSMENQKQTHAKHSSLK